MIAGVGSTLRLASAPVATPEGVTGSNAVRAVSAEALSTGVLSDGTASPVAHAPSRPWVMGSMVCVPPSVARSGDASQCSTGAAWARAAPRSDNIRMRTAATAPTAVHGRACDNRTFFRVVLMEPDQRVFSATPRGSVNVGYFLGLPGFSGTGVGEPVDGGGPVLGGLDRHAE